MKTNRYLRLHKHEGFSLIEMLIVLFILAILAGVTIPIYIGMKPSMRLSGATRQIMGDLMCARMQSISQNNKFKIFFLADNHRYTLLDDDTGDGTIDSGDLTVTKDIHDAYYDVTFSSTAAPIFHPRGNASPTATVTLTNSSGTKTIAIAMTGRVKIQ